jgi:mannose-6-phosphate isomerase
LPLDEAVRRYPVQLLGEEVVERFGRELPFLLKVLSINREHGLSIQTHPTEAGARLLHARDPEHYPDPHHKPEIGLALTPVTLLYGCRTVADVRGTVDAVPALKTFLGEGLVKEIDEGGDESRTVRAIFTRCLTAPEDAVKTTVRAIREQLERSASQPAEADVFLRLLIRYGEVDRGLPLLFFMNIITVEPGQGVFIAPNIPHAYLDGDLVECMACSDNVVRVGLTPKFIDIPTLLEIVDCSTSQGSLIKPSKGDSGEWWYRTPTDEFQIRVYPRGSRTVTLPETDGPVVLLCMGRGASIRRVNSGKTVAVSDGGSVFLPPKSGAYQIVSDDAAVYCVTTGLDSQSR